MQNLTCILIIARIQIIMLQKDEIRFCLETYFFSLSIFHCDMKILSFLSAAKAVKAKLHVIFIEHTRCGAYL